MKAREYPWWDHALFATAYHPKVFHWMAKRPAIIWRIYLAGDPLRRGAKRAAQSKGLR